MYLELAQYSTCRFSEEEIDDVNRAWREAERKSAKRFKNNGWKNESAGGNIQVDLEARILLRASFWTEDFVQASSSRLCGKVQKLDEIGVAELLVKKTMEAVVTMYAATSSHILCCHGCMYFDFESMSGSTPFQTRVVLVFGVRPLPGATHDIAGFKIFAKELDPNMVVLMAARAFRVENQSVIDDAMVGIYPHHSNSDSCLSVENHTDFV
ncbi:hypothetical protein SSX86_029919 [Deinandra increscens subsp. villosa]|uniref:Uncharacterized protein n=1 Tax=Deinandra increscens subsp. villosa TaxID=3103831 RepID=A0AAP0CC98_9ASTR